MNRAFRSLNSPNYRIWAAGALVSNIGTGMQRTAQDWLVLTQLTAHNAVALGVVTGLQFGPQLLLLPWTGFAADHLDRRKLLIATQAAMAALSLGLAVMTLAGVVRLWQLYLFAFLFGCAAAFDAPARQSFVSELVGDADLSNAVALNSMSFNAAGMVGPACAGILIGAFGCGWAFLINAFSFMAMLCSLGLLHQDALHRSGRALRGRGGLMEGFRYVWRRPDLRAILWMLFLIGTFGMNFPIFISTMSVTVFHAGARQYGLLTSTMAIGTIAGSLIAAGQETPRFNRLLVSAAVFGFGLAIAAVMPDIWLFGAALIIVGVSVLTFTNATNSLMQLTTDPSMRGRVMALRVAIALGGAPIGAPVIGWIANTDGPRWALAVGALAAFAAVIVVIFHRMDSRGEP